jgi:hypothetical protein
MARSSECTEQYAQKVFDNADIVRDAIFHQSSGAPCGECRFSQMTDTFLFVTTVSFR